MLIWLGVICSNRYLAVDLQTRVSLKKPVPLPGTPPFPNYSALMQKRILDLCKSQFCDPRRHSQSVYVTPGIAVTEWRLNGSCSLQVFYSPTPLPITESQQSWIGTTICLQVLPASWHTELTTSTDRPFKCPSTVLKIKNGSNIENLEVRCLHCSVLVPEH